MEMCSCLASGASPLKHLTTSVASALNGRILASTFPSILTLALAHFWQLGYRQLYLLLLLMSIPTIDWDPLFNTLHALNSVD